MGFDVNKIRKDFPIFHSEEPLVFLDSAASSQKPNSVIERLSHYYSLENSNIHRGVYKLSREATESFEKVRIKISSFINANCAKAIIFTRGTTESINIVAKVWGHENISRGDEIVLNELEHHSNLVPWQMLAQEKKAKLKFLPLLDDSTLDYSKLDETITPATKLVCISQMSNVTGTIHELKRVIAKAREVGAFVLVDGAQGASHLPVDVKNLDVDFYAFSAHKMLGPTGVGVLYGKEEILERMGPWLGGGDMIETVEMNRFTLAPLPAKLEAGTPNIGGVIGFGEAIEYLQQVGLSNIHEHEQSLLKYAISKLEKIDGVELFGTSNLEKRGGVLSFNLKDIHPHDVGSVLDEEGVCIRVGHHCAQPFMKRMGVPGTCRASFYLYNTLEDVDALAEAILKTQRLFQRARKKLTPVS